MLAVNDDARVTAGDAGHVEANVSVKRSTEDAFGPSDGDTPVPPDHPATATGKRGTGDTSCVVTGARIHTGNVIEDADGASWWAAERAAG